MDAIAPAADGFHHPASEDELVALVKMAYDEGRQLRVRGAVHSLSHVIYSDPIHNQHVINKIADDRYSDLWPHDVDDVW